MIMQVEIDGVLKEHINPELVPNCSSTFQESMIKRIGLFCDLSATVSNSTYQI